MTKSPFYLTTPIYYVNALPHLGHAYTTIAADAMARYRRLMDDDVWFLTGTDEHGDNIARVAAKAGESPKAYADRISAAFSKAWKELGIEPSDFIRTTEERHTRVVREILQKLHDAGEIKLDKYGGHYCFGCERFYTEREIVDGKCPDHQTPLTWIEEENYFFKMSKYQGWLIEYIEQHPDLIRPERYRNEILGFLREPLQDLSISRPKSRLQWGIPLPFGDDQYVTYVWFDALINYVSAIGYPNEPGFAKRWGSVQHLIGKDILKQHAVYWPCMLKAAGLDVFQHLNVHGYWTVDGQKMSKSIGNVVEPLAFKAKYGNDAFRYFILREMPFGLDADFSEAALLGRFNADLANDLGNLVSRATTLIGSFDNGRLPALKQPTASEWGVPEAWQKARDQVERAMQEFAFHRALAAIWEFIGTLNRYIDTAQPWALAKDASKRPRLRSVLYTLGQSIWCLGFILTPFLPEAARRIRGAVGAPENPDDLRPEHGDWNRLDVGRPVQKLAGLFPRIDTKSAGSTLSPQGRGQGEGQVAEAAKIPIDEFAKLELRVAEVLAAEKVAKSKRLLKLTVKVGEEMRTLVAGVAEHYAPADLVGRKVVIVANLQPATLMGIESNGMVLAASHEGTVSLLTLDKDVPSGSKVK